MTRGLLELGEVMVTAAQRRLETVAQNVTNLTTSGFRTGVSFQDSIVSEAQAGTLSVSTDFSQGSMRATGEMFDLALASGGFFRVRGESGVYYTRAGQFSRDGEGYLIDAQGMRLQSADGADIVVGASPIEVTSDGVVVEDGVPIARIGVYEALPDVELARFAGAYFSAPEGAMADVSAPVVRQGMVEGSNVDLPSEMLAMMSALRQAEIGARVVQAYDGLVGQAITTLGRVQS
jgi:flagellar basal-body rod protein FlgF